MSEGTGPYEWQTIGCGAKAQKLDGVVRVTRGTDLREQTTTHSPAPTFHKYPYRLALCFMTTS